MDDLQHGGHVTPQLALLDVFTSVLPVQPFPFHMSDVLAVCVYLHTAKPNLICCMHICLESNFSDWPLIESDQICAFLLTFPNSHGCHGNRHRQNGCKQTKIEGSGSAWSREATVQITYKLQELVWDGGYLCAGSVGMSVQQGTWSWSVPA